MTSLPSLYTISADMMALISQLEDNGGELTPEIENALAITEEQFVAKSEEYGHAILSLKAMAAAAKAEKDRLASLEKFYKNALERIQGALVSAMDVLDHPKVETPSMRLFLRRTKATEVDDVTLLPSDLKTVKVEEVPDKAAIKAAIMEGRDVPGAHIVENVSLQIK